MKQGIKNGLLIIITLIIAYACKRDELDFDKLAKQVQNERDIAVPLVIGEFSIREFIETDEDSILVINGDTLSLIIRQDSIITFEVSDFATIPDLAPVTYISSHDDDIPVSDISVIDTSALEVDSLYSFTMENSMRIDSAFLNTASLTLDITNTFNHRVTLIITSTSIVDQNGNDFIATIPDIPIRGSVNTTLDISNHKIITHELPDNTKALHVKFHPIVYNDNNEDFILSSNSLNIDFGFGDLNDFNAVFGFFGFTTDTYDTTLTDIAPELLEGLDGTFSATNPKIHLVYDQSFGIGSSFDFYMQASYTNKGDVIIDPPVSTINYSTDYQNPEYHDRITWDVNSIPNIGDLISFPFPNELQVRGDIAINEGGDSLTTKNYALWSSMLNFGFEIEIPLEVSADLTYRDTIEFSGITDDNTMVEVDKANLEYWFENYFPLGFDADLILYDSISEVNLDTIKLNTDPATMFLKPAPVDSQGNVISADVSRHDGTVVLDKSTAESLLNEATHIIVQAELITTNTNSVRIGTDAELRFQFGLDAKITLTSK